MTYSLHIKNGDLNLGGPGGFAIVTGSQKLVQDLKNWLLEPRGTDPSHPEYGSVIDGGILPDGSVISSSIGSTIDDERLLEIETELRRVLLAYQQQQLDRLQAESIQYNGKNTFSPGEILYSVQSVDVSRFGNTVIARITILTSAGQQITFTQPVA